jgi:predicted sugar kinase
MNQSSFDSFSPGQNFIIKEKWRKYNFSIKIRKIEIIAPGRLHFSLFDYKKMNPPIPGGGGIGISTDTATVSVCMEYNAEAQDFHITELPPSAQHMALLFLNLLDHNGRGISTSLVFSNNYQHCGLGSNISLNTATFFGLNAIFGNPFSNEEAFEIITSNYIESNGNSQINWGFDTGVGAASIIYGGFVLVDKNCHLKGRIIAEDNPFYTVVAKGNMSTLACKRYFELGIVEHGETGKTEVITNQEFGIKHQKIYGEKLHYYVSNKLINCFNQKSISLLRDVIWELNDYGTFKRMQLSYKEDVLIRFQSMCKENGAFFCGITSAGPSMFALTENLEIAHAIKDEIEKSFSDYFSLPSIGNAGTTISIKYF